MTVDMDPLATFAVVVGIERYDAGWSLDGAASDALGTAEWLRASGVPAGQIHLVIDALPDNLESVGRRVASLGLVSRKASRDNVMDIFTRELTTVDGKHLVVFWSGHGVLDEQHRRALFTADAHTYDRRTVRVEDLLVFLGDKAVRGFHDQIVIVDACANFIDGMTSRTDLTYATFPARGPKSGVRRFVLYAAAQGQIAQHNHAARRGEFTAAVLAALHPPEGPQWPPDMPALSASVAARFDELRAAGYSRQTPVYLSRNVSWVGDEEQREFGGTPVSGRAQQAAIEAGITTSQVRRLTRALAEGCPAVEQGDVVDALRRGTVEDLFAKLALSPEGPLAAAQLRRTWVIWQRIAEPLRQFQDVSLRQLRVYYEIVPDRQIAPRMTELDEVLEYLSDFGDSGESSPLLRFVARLETLTGARLPAAWFGLSTGGLRRLRSMERRRATATSGCHLVIHFPAPEWSSEVDGYLRSSDGVWTKHVVRCTADEQGARHAVNALITWAYDSVAGEPALALGFLVSRARFDDVPERWTYIDELSGERALGEEYPVVLHSSDRMRVPRARAWWRSRLRQISADLEWGEPEILWIDAPLDPKKITQAVRDSTAACVVFSEIPGPLRGALPVDPLIAAISPGAPYMIWLDEAPADWAAMRELITDLVRNGQFDQVPARALKIRQGDVVTSPCPGIRMLWDNQEMLPEFGQLGGIEVRTI